MQPVPNRVKHTVLDSGIDPTFAVVGDYGRQEPAYRDVLHQFFGYVAQNDAKYHWAPLPMRCTGSGRMRSRPSPG